MSDPAFETKVQAAQVATDAMMTEIDKSKIRPLQKASLLKMAACTDLPNRNAIDQCMQKSQHAMNIAQQVTQNEMQTLQNRMQRCMMDCQDAVQDSNYKSDDSREKLFFSCATSCVDKNMALLKSIKARIESEIDKGVKSL